MQMIDFGPLPYSLCRLSGTCLYHPWELCKPEEHPNLHGICTPSGSIPRHAQCVQLFLSRSVAQPEAAIAPKIEVNRAMFHLKFTGVHPIVALYEGIAKVIYAEFLQAFQC